MLWPFYVFAFVLCGAAWTVLLGRGGLFDYTPTTRQVKPETLKWFAFFFWWFMVPVEALCALARGLKLLNQKVNKFLNVRVDKR